MPAPVQRQRPVRSTRNTNPLTSDPFLETVAADGAPQMHFVEPALAEDTPGVTGHRLEDPPSVRVKKELGVFSKIAKVNSKSSTKLAAYQRQCKQADSKYNDSISHSDIRTALKRSSSDTSTIPATPVTPSKSKKSKKTLNITLKTPTKSSLIIPTRPTSEESNTDSQSNTPSVESVAVNNDYCSCCGMTGMFLCCESCPKSYHFQCINPPIDANNLPEYWYCKECIKKKSQTDKVSTNVGIFATLFDNIMYQDPITFQLPKEIIDSFEGIYTDRLGDYNDDSFKESKSYKQMVKEFDDPLYGVYDKDNNPYLCHHCGDSGLKKEIMNCDYCALSWHLDCLDPPLTNIKKLGTKWKCPAHVDDLGKPLRKFKNQQVVHVTNIENFEKSGKLPINATIEIINIEDKLEALKEELKSLYDGSNLNLKYNNLTFHLNEENVILDFIKSTKIKKLHEDGKNIELMMNLKPSLKDYVQSLSKLSNKSLLSSDSRMVNLEKLLKVTKDELKVEENDFTKDEIRELILIKKLINKKGKDKLLEFLKN